jgi:hypothetical protein
VEKATELEFLKYFYNAAGDSFGPEDSEIYEAIKQGFKKWKKKELPEGYELSYDE